MDRAATLADSELFDDEDPRATALTPPPPPLAEVPRPSKLRWVAMAATVVGAAVAFALAGAREQPPHAAARHVVAAPSAVAEPAREAPLALAAAPQPNALAKGKVKPTPSAHAKQTVSKRAIASAKGKGKAKPAKVAKSRKPGVAPAKPK